MLICAGADINTRSLQGLTPAQIAPEPLKKLLQANREGMFFEIWTITNPDLYWM
jgi:hypothetical protein